MTTTFDSSGGSEKKVYVRTYIRTYVRTYVRTYGRTDGRTEGRTDGGTYVVEMTTDIEDAYKMSQMRPKHS